MNIGIACNISLSILSLSVRDMNMHDEMMNIVVCERKLFVCLPRQHFSH